MKRLHLAFIALSNLTIASTASAEPPAVVQTFSGDGGTSYTTFHHGLAGPPRADGGALMLTVPFRHGNTSSGIVFAEAVAESPSTVEAEFSFRVTHGAHGFSFFLAPEGTDFAALCSIAAPTAWEGPNAPGLFAVGFNLHNPPTSNWFDKHGNFHGRPQREVSLHWNRNEITRTLSELAYDDGEPHRAKVSLRNIPGAVEASLHLDGQPLLDRVAIEGMALGRVVAGFAARTGSTTAGISIDDVQVSFGPAAEPAGGSHEQLILDDVLVHGKRRTPVIDVAFPADPGTFERVNLRLELRGPAGGCDPWDKSASLRLLGDKEGQHTELARFITPFGVPATWDLDVTQLQHLLRGPRKLQLFVDTWMDEAADPALQKGWLISATISRHGKLSKGNNVSIIPLWSGEAKLGSIAAPYPDFFDAREISVPEGTTRARVFLTATGHGQFGEFTPFTRTMRVNGSDFTNKLWREDCYLNPVRPQGGTWKFDRAGWCPGSIVPPWSVDVTHLVEPGGALHIEHIAHPYEGAPQPPPEDWSNLMIESYVVFEGR